MTAKERVREEYAKWLHSYAIGIRQENAKWLEKMPFEDLSPDTQERWREKADELLSLVEIKSADQRLPTTLAYHLSLVRVYQQDIEKANFVKVEKK